MVSHISRKTSEMWGTRPSCREPEILPCLFQSFVARLEQAVTDLAPGNLPSDYLPPRINSCV